MLNLFVSILINFRMAAPPYEEACYLKGKLFTQKNYGPGVLDSDSNLDEEEWTDPLWNALQSDEYVLKF